MNIARVAGWVMGILALNSALLASPEPERPVSGAHEEWPEMDGVDYTPLEMHVRKRGLEIADGQLASLVKRNFRFVFLNKVNRARFLTSPRPDRIAQKMLQVLELNDELTELIREGRKMIAAGRLRDQEGNPGECRKLVGEIDRVARDFRSAFNNHFLEIHQSNYAISFPPGENFDRHFLFFLIQADKINQQLTAKLNHYFFTSVPGAVDLSEYNQVSIAVLSEALIKLSGLLKKHAR